jgi:DNA polymerase-3 subunit gamma/tau
MSYQAFYRQYRPKTFSEVVGQQVIVRILKNQLTKNTIGHAYLFCGPRGTGKTSLAKILARAVNCLNPVEGEPCMECSSCRAITRGETIDVAEIDAASNNSVDDIRQLRDQAKYAPAILKYKVFIIDEVHTLSNSAWNALLKILEEPPKHLIFILATTEFHKVPATILSRCQRFDFHNLDDRDLASKLNEIIQKENLTVDQAAIDLICRLSNGGMRDAISLLDQAVSFAESGITTEVINQITGGVSQEILEQLVISIAQHDVKKVVEIYEEQLSYGKEVVRFFSDLIDYLRSVYLNALYGKTGRTSPLEVDLIYPLIHEIDRILTSLVNFNNKKVLGEIGLIQIAKEFDQPVISSHKVRTEEGKVEHKTSPKVHSESSKGSEVSTPIVNASTSENVVKSPEIVPPVRAVRNEPEPENYQTRKVLIQDIEEVFNESKKPLRKQMEDFLAKQSEKDKRLTDLSVGCTSPTGAVLYAKDDTGQLYYMGPKIYFEILAILQKKFPEMTKFYCLGNSTWNTIRIDYLDKYQKYEVVTLNDIPLEITEPLPPKKVHPRDKYDKFLGAENYTIKNEGETK